MKKKTAKGNVVDLEVLKRSQGSTRAVGNMNVNTLGDQIDSNNRVVKSRDQIVRDFYTNKNNINVPQAGAIGESSEQPKLPTAEDRAKAAAADLAAARAKVAADKPVPETTTLTK